MSGGALRELFAIFDVKVDTGELTKAHGQLEAAKGAAEQLGEGFEKLKVIAEAALIGLGVERLAEMTQELAKEALTLDASAAAVGLSADELEHWQDVAEATGQSGQGLAFIFKVLSRNAYEASEGSKEASKAFKELGVDVGKGEDLKSGSALLDEVTSALAGIENPAKRAALAQATLGRGALTLLPALARGKEGLEELSHVLEENGAAFDEEFIAMSKQAAIDTFKWERALVQLKVILAKQILPLLERFENAVVGFLKPIMSYLKVQENVNTLLLAAALVALPAIVTALGGLAGILRILRILAVEAFLPFFVVAGVIALIQDFFVFLKGGDSLIGAFFNKIGGPGGAKMIREKLLEAFEAIKIKGAELWEALKTYFGELYDAVRPIVDAFDEWHGNTEDLIAVLDVLAVVFGAIVATRVAGALAAITTSIQAMVATNPALAALTAALTALYLAWQQIEQFGKETGGLGVLGTIQQMRQQGTWNPFKAVDTFQNQQARAEASDAAQAEATADPLLNNIRQFSRNQSGTSGLPSFLAEPATGGKTITINDQRSTEVTVGGNVPTPGAVGRAAAAGAGGVQAHDMNAILDAVR